MFTAAQRPLLATLAVVLLGLSGCGKGAPAQISGGGPARSLAPVQAQGAVSLSTRNTTRLGGSDVAADAAGVARAVYPGLTAASRPAVVVLVDEHDWWAALAASVLAGAPTGAPLLFSEGSTVPSVSRQTLEAMHPLGAAAIGGAQVISLGVHATLPGHTLVHTVAVGTPAATAAAIERLTLTLDGSHAPRQVIVLGQGASRALAMPAAGLAAQSGAPILFVASAGVPSATAAALASLHRPSIYVIDAPAIGRHTLTQLAHYGQLTTIPSGKAGGLAEAPVQGAIEVARFTDSTFGWGVKEPGHGLVFATVGRPLDAPAAALLSATGDYGPLLLLSSRAAIPGSLAQYLSDIQPAYASPRFPPDRGAYNHGWLIGGESAISAVSQAEIDSLLEIEPRAQTQEESTASEVE
jgi:ell wall binding domain 2 (CWB2)